MQAPDVLAGTGLGVLRIVQVDDAATVKGPALGALHPVAQPPRGSGTMFTIRGPLTYAGPGSLGGTESALRR